MGFEPTRPCALTIFRTVAFDRSAISPRCAQLGEYALGENLTSARADVLARSASPGHERGRPGRRSGLRFEARSRVRFLWSPSGVTCGHVPGWAREIRTARERLKQQTLKLRQRINRGLPVKPEERILPAMYRGSLP